MLDKKKPKPKDTYKQPRASNGRFVRLCPSCGIFEVDKDFKVCDGCEAYRDHQR